MRALLFGLSVFFALLPQPYPAVRADNPPAGITFLQDIEYGIAGGESLKLNLSLPAAAAKDAAAKFPLVLVIHGGAWRWGDRSDHDALTWDLAEKGFVAATVDYRFCPEHKFPAQVLDVQCAVRFLRASAAKYHLDPERVGAVGFSAGGQLAMMLGTLDAKDVLSDNADGSGGTTGTNGSAALSSKVQAVVSYFGPTDFEIPVNDTTRPLVRDFLGPNNADKPEAQRRASPVHYLNKGDAPLLLFQGTADAIVPLAHATRMAGALQEAGVAGRVELIAGAGHGEWSAAEYARTWAAMTAFFEEHLNSK